MSTIHGVRDERFNFVQLLNSMFEETNLSLKAKGFIGYCLTKPPGWKFHISHLSSVLKEGERAIYSTINECVEFGYAVRYQTRKEDGDFGEWDTIISDSKFQIEKVKKQLEKDPDFQKSLTLRGFADAQSADAQSVPLSNTNKKVILEEQQQQAEPACAVFPEAPKKEKAKIKIYPCLDPIHIPQKLKEKLTRDFSEEIVINAIGWSTAPQNPPSVSLSASIVYACNHGLSLKNLQDRKESPFEMASKLFKHGEIYNGADCYLTREYIGFVRTMKEGKVKFDEFFSMKKLKSLCESFQIPLPRPA